MKLTASPQSIEQYYLLRRASKPSKDKLRIGAPMRWTDAGALPLCLLTPDMHNRTIIDQAFREAGVEVAPAIETNSVLTLALAVIAGDVCSVLPGAMVAAVRGLRELEALPLIEPEVRTSIGFLTQDGVRPSRALGAALELLQTPEWKAQIAQHSGALDA